MSRRRRIVSSLIAGAAVVLGAVVQAAPAQAVANGQDVLDGQYEFSVALSMPLITRADGSTYVSACSAVLIDPQWLLTAGHCAHDGNRVRINGTPRYQITATIGQATLSGTTGTKVDVVHIVQNENADIALAKLATPVYDVTPISLATTEPVAGDVVRLTGWGSRDGVADLTHRPDRMQTGQMTVSRTDATLAYVKGAAPLPTTSACPYDSGAPYFSESTTGEVRLVATEVGGPSCPHAGEDRAARVDVLVPWVQEHISLGS